MGKSTEGGNAVGKLRRVWVVLVAASVSCVLAASANASPQGPPLRLQFLGQAIVPTGTQFDGTTVGGLSSITWDPLRNVYYAISDDPSQFQPARFYTIRLDVGNGELSAGDVQFAGVTTLLAPDGQPYAPFSLDPEGLALTQDRTLIATSEGFTDRLIPPWIRQYSLDGRFLGDLPVPDAFMPTADHSSGVQPNLAFESAGIPQNGNFLFTGVENALYQDGPAATIAHGSPSRIMRYDLQTGQLDRQWLYYQDVNDNVQLDFYAGADFGCGPNCRARLRQPAREFRKERRRSIRNPHVRLDANSECFSSNEPDAQMCEGRSWESARGPQCNARARHCTRRPRPDFQVQSRRNSSLQ